MTWRNILCPACHTKSATPFHVPIWQLQFELGLLMMSFAQNYTNYMGSLQCWSWNHNTAAAYFFWSSKSRPVKLRCLRNSLDKGRPKSGKMDPRKLAWVDTEASESEIGRRWKKQRMWGLKMCFLPTWAAGADATVKRPALTHIRRPWSQQGIYPGNLVHNVSHMLQKNQIKHAHIWCQLWCWKAAAAKQEASHAQHAIELEELKHPARPETA